MASDGVVVIQRHSGPVVESHRGVFSQLAQGRKGVLVGPAHPLDHLLRVGGQHVDLHLHRLLLLLLFLSSVVSDHCGRVGEVVFEAGV